MALNMERAPARSRPSVIPRLMCLRSISKDYRTRNAVVKREEKEELPWRQLAQCDPGTFCSPVIRPSVLRASGCSGFLGRHSDGRMRSSPRDRGRAGIDLNEIGGRIPLGVKLA